MEEKERLNRFSDAAERLAISYSTLNRLAARGDIRFVRISWQRFVPESELMRLMREGTRRQAA